MTGKIGNRSSPPAPQALQKQALDLGKKLETALAPQVAKGGRAGAVDEMASGRPVAGDVQAMTKELQAVLGELSKVWLPSMLQGLMDRLPEVAVKALKSANGPIAPLPQAIREVNRELHAFEAQFRSTLDVVEKKASALTEYSGPAHFMVGRTEEQYLASREREHNAAFVEKTAGRSLWQRMTEKVDVPPFDVARAKQEIAAVQEQVRAANVALKASYPFVADALLTPVPFIDERSRPWRDDETMQAMRQRQPQYVALVKKRAELTGQFREQYGLSDANLEKVRAKQLDPARTLEVIHGEALTIVNELDAMAQTSRPAKETVASQTTSLSETDSTSTSYWPRAPDPHGRRLSFQTGQTVTSSSSGTSSSSRSEVLLGEGRQFLFSFVLDSDDPKSMSRFDLSTGSPYEPPRAAGPRALYLDEAPVLAHKLLTLGRLLAEAEYKYPGAPETRDLHAWVANTKLELRLHGASDFVRQQEPLRSASFTLARFPDELSQLRYDGFRMTQPGDAKFLLEEINAPLRR